MTETRSSLYELITPNSLADLKGWCWYNGMSANRRNKTIKASNLVRLSAATVSILNHSMQNASGLIEGTRVIEGKIIQPIEHITRFLEGAKKLRFEIPHTVETLMSATQEVVRAQGIATGYIRMNAFYGTGFLYFSPRRNRTNVSICAWPSDLYKPFKLIEAEMRRPHQNASYFDTKASCNYGVAVQEQARAEEQGFNDALLSDWEGNVADVTGANIGLTIDNALHIPEPNGFFQGITCKTVMELARKEGIEVCVRKIPPHNLSTAEEVFLMGTATGILPVLEIKMNNQDVYRYAGTQGPLTQKIQKMHRDCVMSLKP